MSAADAKYTVADIPAPDEWDAFTVEAYGGSLFSTTRWLDAVATVFGGTVRLLGVYDKNGCLLGGAAFIEDAKGPFKRAYTPIVSPYGGIVVGHSESGRRSRQEHLANRVAETLTAHCMSEYDYIVLNHEPAIADMRIFIWAGWDVSVRYTYRVKMGDGEESIWTAFDSNVRKNIRKAEKALRMDTPPDTGGFIRLYRQVFAEKEAAQGLDPAQLGRFIDSLADAGIGKLDAAYTHGGVCAGALHYVESPEGVYTMYAGMDQELYHLNASSLLYWEVMRRYAGIAGVFDLVGANIELVANYKRAFEGKLVPYYTTEWYRSPLMRKAFTTYRMMRSMLPW